MALFKKLVRICLQTGLRSDKLWAIARRRPLPGVLTARRKIIAGRLAKIFADAPTVRAGPFQGLRYPSLQSAGSVLVPKLLGTYESELHATIGSLVGLDFGTIVDVGCAEGYYAVGLARLFPAARVRAYDIAPMARRLCGAMAAANRAANLTVHEACDQRELLGLPANERHLIVSDCEGYEKTLFTREVLRHLAACYFIVELHDFRDPSITPTLAPLFRATHQVESITSIADSEKGRRYDSPLLTSDDEFERGAAFAENRPDCMQWLVARPRPVAAAPGISATAGSVGA